MAKIDDLMKQVGDARLRRDLEAAVAELKKRTRFGLVYENHLPETTALPGLPIVEGAWVVRRDKVSGRHAFKVCGVADGVATLEPLGGGGGEQRCPVAELIALQRFGEPIYPGLQTLGSVERGGPERGHHAVINAENYHAAQLLLHLYEGQVDCLYLDPPYNTGARDWTYNNDYVDGNDVFRHSKWLSFMEKRLRLAKRLLRPDGVLIVTIDEHEVHHLGVLLEEVFPQYLRYMVTIVINPSGTGKENFSRVEEYAFFCCPNIGTPTITGAMLDLLPEPDEITVDGGEDAEDENDHLSFNEVVRPSEKRNKVRWMSALRSGSAGRRVDRPSMFYPIYIDEESGSVIKTGSPLPIDEQPSYDRVNGLLPLWPISNNGNLARWQVGRTEMERKIAKQEVKLGQYVKSRKTWAVLFLPKALRGVEEHSAVYRQIKTVWRHRSHDSGAHGSSFLNNLLGESRLFAFPKSVYAVKDCLAAVTRTRPHALIVDFFAGSGTTLHATCLLNAEDNGQRRCILVTNNEVGEADTRALHAEGHYKGGPQYEARGIFQRVTRPRVTAALTGTRPDGSPVPGAYIGGRPMSDGFAENVSFFALQYLNPDRVDMGQQYAAIAPLLWLQSGAAGAWDDSDAAKRGSGYALLPGARYAVLFREGKFGAFCDALQARPDVTHVSLVTNSEDAFTQMRAALPARLQVHRLYRDYLRSFRLKEPSQ